MISSELKNEFDTDVVSYAYNFAVWETQKNDCSEMLSLIDAYLNSDLDLITVQLGENVTDLSTYESDLYYLLEHIKEKSPNAKAVVISDFWEMDGRDEAKTKAVNKSNFP